MDQLALLLESTGEGIFGVDLDGKCMFINRAGAQMLGWQPQEVLGRNMHQLTHHSHPDGTPYPDSECPILNTFRRGLACRLDSEVLWRRDGTAFPAEYSSHPVIDHGTVKGAVITFTDITERKRARELSQALSQARVLAAYSEKVREEERTRIAREVHDELGSLLVALKMDVNWLDKRLAQPPAGELADEEDLRRRLRCKCQKMGALIERAVENVGRIITDLRPSILDHQGLWAALEWQADEFVRSSELSLHWDMRLPDPPTLAEPRAMAVFRIFQEMLSNVARHAHASRVTVRVWREADRLHLQVADDGRGAPTAAFDAPNAYGIMGMRERARHFGGRITIDSVDGRGSTFTLELPISDA